VDKIEASRLHARHNVDEPSSSLFKWLFRQSKAFYDLLGALYEDQRSFARSAEQLVRKRRAHAKDFGRRVGPRKGRQ